MPAQIHQLDTSLDTAYLREALRLLVQSLIEVEVSAHIEANPYERKDSRRTQRNGYRRRSWRSGLGEITLFIPKLRKGTYYPAFLDSLRQSERKLLELAQDAYEREADWREIGRVADWLGLRLIERNHLAEIEERLHDLVERHKLHQVSANETTAPPISMLFGAEDWLEQSNILSLAA